MKRLDSVWHPPQQAATFPTLADDEVHVWRAGLALPDERVRGLLEILSPEERERANRFRFQRHRACLMASHGILRIILGKYLAVAPAELYFRYGSNGKPEVAGEHGRRDIQFNMSRSHQLAVYAFTCCRKVGIDIEYIREGLEQEQLAQRYFTPQEIAVFCSSPVDQRSRAFFSCWTRKEACLKARGDGLSVLLSKFDATLSSADSVAEWFLYELDMGPNYAAAVAVEGDACNIRYWQWEELSAALEAQRTAQVLVRPQRNGDERAGR
jgi:4'-phosphopantetheinyl transferase